MVCCAAASSEEAAMVMTKAELIGSLQHEVDILLHLASKIDRTALDYRPTPKQRSTLELLQYLTIMGPGLIDAANAGKFDPAAWTALQRQAAARSFEQTVAAITAQRGGYAASIGAISDADLRAEITMLGRTTTRGAFLVN